MKIDWESSSSEVLINPHYSQEDHALFNTIKEKTESRWPGHIWVSTSGSSLPKWVGLSKKAILASAQAVNAHLKSDSSDRWIQALPHFHVGGIGIWARSYLSGAVVHDFKKPQEKGIAKWDPLSFYEFIKKNEGTLTALVPSQLHDFVQLGLRGPPSLRAVIIGGGALLPDLYFKAIQLGWNVLPSYGLTECASQVATAEIGSWSTQQFPRLKVLSHMKVKEDNGCLSFSGSSLLSTYVIFEESKIIFFDPKQEGWFRSEDRGRADIGGFVEIFGRSDHMIKIGGESVDVSKLEALLQKIKMRLAPQADMTLVVAPDERLGKVIHLAIATLVIDNIHQSVIDEFQYSVLPFERIRRTHCIPSIPRSPLAKVLVKELNKIIF